VSIVDEVQHRRHLCPAAVLPSITGAARVFLSAQSLLFIKTPYTCGQYQIFDIRLSARLFGSDFSPLAPNGDLEAADASLPTHSQTAAYSIIRPLRPLFEHDDRYLAATSSAALCGACSRHQPS
jgi:hypothetical protein